MSAAHHFRLPAVRTRIWYSPSYAVPMLPTGWTVTAINVRTVNALTGAQTACPNANDTNLQLVKVTVTP